MTTISPLQLLAKMNWRYATKRFDSGRKIAPEIWAALEEVLILTPSSGGLQPWKFIVITDPEVRAKLTPVSHGQTQINDASHLVVIATKTDFGEADIDAHIEHMAKIQGVPVEALTPLRNVMKTAILSMDEVTVKAWARNQAYIALGNLLTSAAVLGIDACPMEGFDRAQYDELLGLKAKGLASAVIATLGYRSPSDKYATAPKVRFPKEQVILSI